MKMTNITIPPAALEAGAEAFLECDRSPACSFEDALRAAFLAMIEAWEGAKTIRDDGRRQTYAIPALILPLTEQTDDKA